MVPECQLSVSRTFHTTWLFEWSFNFDEGFRVSEPHEWRQRVQRE
jgi:hypothetical protein